MFSRLFRTDRKPKFDANLASLDEFAAALHRRIQNHPSAQAEPIPLEDPLDCANRNTLIAWGLFNPSGPTSSRLDLLPLSSRHEAVLSYVRDHPFAPRYCALDVLSWRDEGDSALLLEALERVFAANGSDDYPLIGALPSYVRVFPTSPITREVASTLFGLACRSARQSGFSDASRQILQRWEDPWALATDELHNALADPRVRASMERLQEVLRRMPETPVPDPEPSPLTRLLARLRRQRRLLRASAAPSDEERASAPGATFDEEQFRFWFSLVSEPDRVERLEKAMAEGWVGSQEFRAEHGNLFRLTGRVTPSEWPGSRGRMTSPTPEAFWDRWINQPALCGMGFAPAELVVDVHVGGEEIEEGLRCLADSTLALYRDDPEWETTSVNNIARRAFINAIPDLGQNTGRPMGLSELTEAIAAGLDSKDWFADLAEWLGRELGLQNVNEAAVLLGLCMGCTTSLITLRNTVRTMCVARELSASGQLTASYFADRLKGSHLTTLRIRRVLDAYLSGVVQLKTGLRGACYTASLLAAAHSNLSGSAPFQEQVFYRLHDLRVPHLSVQDVWMERVLGYRNPGILSYYDEAFRFSIAFLNVAAQELELRYYEAQAAAWFVIRQIYIHPSSSEIAAKLDQGAIGIGEAVREAKQAGALDSSLRSGLDAAAAHPLIRQELEAFHRIDGRSLRPPTDHAGSIQVEYLAG